MTRPVSIFFSYSSRDESLREELETHLSVVRREGLIAPWSFRKIEAGAVWEDAISEKLLTADVILLLITAHFLNSDYCWGVELKSALNRHDSGETTVIPIILRDCDWKTQRFARLQALPTGGKPVTRFRSRDAAWTDVVLGIRRVVASLHASQRDSNTAPEHSTAVVTQPCTDCYTQKVSEAHPALIQLVLDDSGSMAMHLISGSSRYQWIAACAGSILTELLYRSTELRDGQPAILRRYYLDVIRYGSSVEPWSLAELDIGEAAKRFDAERGNFGLGGKLEGTDHAGAFRTAYERMCRMLAKPQFRDSFPPIVLHVTDGESQTNAETFARDLASLESSNGNVLITNVYLTARTHLTYTSIQDFPGYVTPDDIGSNEDNLRLFRMSSVIPDVVRLRLVQSGVFSSLRAGARLFFTGDMAAVAMRAITLAYPDDGNAA